MEDTTPSQGCNTCRYQPVTLSLAIGIITLSLYLPAAGFDFVHLDDYHYVAENPFIENGLSLRNVLGVFTSAFNKNWHPVTWLSYLLDYELFGLNASGYHFVNVLIHTANSILLFWVLRSMTGANWKSFLVAALFAWHPLHVESVAWISERKDVLCAFFWILTLWAHWRYAHKPCGKRNLLPLLFCCLALMAKPMAVTLPIVLLLMDVWPLRRFGNSIETDGSLKKQAGKLLLEKMTLFIVVLFTCILTIRAQHLGGAVKSLDHLPLLPRLTNTFIAYVAYLGKMIWPVDLAVIYPHPHQTRLGIAIISATLFLAITFWTLRLWRKCPFLTVGWLLYVITLVPVIGIIQVGVQSLADRYTYIPLIGIFIMIAWGMEAFANQRRFLKPVVAAVCCVALILCVLLTRFQIFYWRDSVTLFSHTLAVTENNWTAHWAIGCAFNENKQFEKAEAHLRKAILIEPDETRVYLNLASSLSEQDKTEQAIATLHEALRIDPDDASVHYRLGTLYPTENDFERALAHYRKAQNLVPDSRNIKNSIAWILSTCPDPSIRNGQEAIQLAEQLEDAFAKKINADYLCTLAAAYAETARFQKAISTAENAVDAALSEKHQDDALIELISNCLEHYHQGLPYRDMSGTTE